MPIPGTKSLSLLSIAPNVQIPYHWLVSGMRNWHCYISNVRTDENIDSSKTEGSDQFQFFFCFSAHHCCLLKCWSRFNCYKWFCPTKKQRPMECLPFEHKLHRLSTTESHPFRLWEGSNLVTWKKFQSLQTKHFHCILSTFTTLSESTLVIHVSNWLPKNGDVKVFAQNKVN